MLRVFGVHVQRQGCFFHLTHSTWHKMQELGLVAHYRDDADARRGMLDGLAFLPLTEPASPTSGGSPQMSLSTLSIISMPHTSQAGTALYS